MSGFPHQKYTLVVKGDVVFVKSKADGTTVGVYKNGEFYRYSTAKKKKQRIRNHANGKS